MGKADQKWLTSDEVAESMSEIETKGFDHCPLLEAAGNPIGLLHRAEILRWRDAGQDIEASHPSRLQALLRQCDALEAQWHQTRTLGANLLDSTLHHLLAA